MSDTVKLIIEIPKSDYKAICANKEDAVIAHDTCRRIAHGIPLDDVLDKTKGYVEHIRNTGMGKKKSLNFIEKYIEGLKAEGIDPNDLTHIFDGVTEIPKDAFKVWTTEVVRAESEVKPNE